jgi:hypothetical protein
VPNQFALLDPSRATQFTADLLEVVRRLECVFVSHGRRLDGLARLRDINDTQRVLQGLSAVQSERLLEQALGASTSVMAGLGAIYVARLVAHDSRPDGESSSRLEVDLKNRMRKHLKGEDALRILELGRNHSNARIRAAAQSELPPEPPGRSND